MFVYDSFLLIFLTLLCLLEQLFWKESFVFEYDTLWGHGMAMVHRVEGYLLSH
jgi:hypothetical protein